MYMKKLNISKNCDACGVCCVSGNYILEDENGDMHVNNGGYLSVNEIESARKLTMVCPINALSIVDAGYTNKKGYSGVKEILENLKLEINNIVGLPIPDSRDFSLTDDFCKVESIPSSSGEYQYIYSSEKSAENAASSQFSALMYSNIDEIIRSMVIKYKINTMRKYYVDDEYSAFYMKTKSITDKMKECVCAIKALVEDYSFIPDDFCTGKLFAEDNKYSTARMLRDNDLFNSEIVSMIRREFNKDSGTKLRDYDCYWNTDSHDEFIKSGTFGDKYKYTYCYYNLEEAFKALAKDIESAFKYSGIEDKAIEYVDKLVKEYNQSIEQFKKDKICQIDDCLRYVEGKCRADDGIFELEKSEDYDFSISSLQNGLDFYYGNNNIQIDYGKAFKIFQVYSDNGDAEAKYMLGLCYYHGNGTSMNYQKAIQIMEDSISMGCKKGCEIVGLCYYNGTGVKQDLEKAIKYLEEVNKDE